MNKFIKKLVVLAVGAFTALGIGVSGHSTEVQAATGASMSITHGNFTEITASYTTKFTHTYEIDDLNGGKVNVPVEAYGVYKNGNGIQMNKGKGTYIKNTSALPGAITNISMTWTAAGKNSPTLYVNSGAEASKSSMSLGLQSSATTTQSVDVDPAAGYDYFYFDGTTTTGACYMSELKITYDTAAAKMESITLKADGVETDSLRLELDEMYEGLTVEYAPLEIDDPTIDWTSTNRDVAYYEDGVIFAMGVGEATITATAHDGGGATASLDVTVYDPAMPVLTGVTVTGTPVTPQFVGNAFDYTGLTFTPVYDKTNDNPDVITGADIEWPVLTAGMATIIGSYNGLDVVVEGVEVLEDTVVSIAISGEMTKKNYHLEETWNPEGLVVTETYLSGETKEVTEGIEWSYDVAIADLGIGDSKSVNVTAKVGALTSEAYEVTGITIVEAPAVGSSTFDFMTNGVKMSELTTPLVEGSISLKANANGGSSLGAYTAPIRVYSKNQLIFTGADDVEGITSIEIVANSASYADAIVASSWSTTAEVTKDDVNVTVTFTTPVKEVTYTNANSQSRMNSFVVNYNKVKVDENKKVESITLTPNPLELEVNQSEALIAEVLPGNAFDRTVTWASEDGEIASVDTEGNVTAVKVGTTTITATANDGSGVVGSATVNVTAAPVIDYAPEAKIDGDTMDANGVTFGITKEGTGTYTGYGVNGAQFGSSKNDITVTFETTANKFETSGLKVRVGAAYSSDGPATLRVLVGDTQIGETISLTKTATVYEFSPAAVEGASAKASTSDTLKVELHNDSGAVYLKSLSVYGEMSEITEADKVQELVDLMNTLDTCTDYEQAADVRAKYDALSEEGKATFDATVGTDGATMQAKLAYMEMLIEIGGPDNGSEAAPITKVVDNEVSIALITLVAVLGLSAVAAYYFLNKKRIGA